MSFNKTKSHVINPLDFCIILIAASFLLGGMFKLYNQHLYMLFNKSEKADISIIIPLNQEVKADFFKKGSIVALANGEELGKIADTINVKEKRYSAINNTLFYDYTDNITSVIVRLETRVKRNDSRFYIGNTLCVSPGSEISIVIDENKITSAQIDSITIK